MGLTSMSPNAPNQSPALTNMGLDFDFANPSYRQQILSPIVPAQAATKLGPFAGSRGRIHNFSGVSR